MSPDQQLKFKPVWISSTAIPNEAKSFQPCTKSTLRNTWHPHEIIGMIKKREEVYIKFNLPPAPTEIIGMFQKGSYTSSLINPRPLKGSYTTSSITLPSSLVKGAITKHRVKPYEKIWCGIKVQLGYSVFNLPPALMYLARRCCVSRPTTEV